MVSLTQIMNRLQGFCYAMLMDPYRTVQLLCTAFSCKGFTVQIPWLRSETYRLLFAALAVTPDRGQSVCMRRCSTGVLVVILIGARGKNTNLTSPLLLCTSTQYQRNKCQGQTQMTRTRTRTAVFAQIQSTPCREGKYMKTTQSLSVLVRRLIATVRNAETEEICEPSANSFPPCHSIGIWYHEFQEKKTWGCGEHIEKKKKKKCRNPGLNQGPLDLQSNALPTELFRLAHKRR